MELRKLINGFNLKSLSDRNKYRLGVFCGFVAITTLISVLWQTSLFIALIIAFIMVSVTVFDRLGYIFTNKKDG